MSKNGVPLPHLRAWRERAFLTQEVLSGLAGLSRLTVQSIEVGRYRASYHSIQALAEALTITPQQLVETDPRKQEVKV